MSNVMMQLGFFQFSLSTAAYQELDRTTEYKWARQTRIGTHDQLQFVGHGPDNIEVKGAIYPEFRGGLGQLDKMRLQAGLGVPMPMVSGTGKVMGIWCVESITEGQRVFKKHGVPKRQDFSMRITRYDGGLRSLLRF